MAKQASINISINTQNAIKSIGDLNNELNGTVSTIGDLRMTVEALTAELESTEYGTDRWVELKNAVIQANTELKNYELSMESLDNEQMASELKSVAGGLTEVVGAMVLFGASSESAEKVIQTFAKVEAVTKGVTGAMEAYSSGAKVLNSILARSAAAQEVMAAATAASSAAQQSGTVATTAFGGAASGAATKFKMLTAVLKANPIIAIASAILAVVGAMALFSGSQDKAAADAQKLNKQLENQISFLDLLNTKAQRISTFKIERYKIEEEAAILANQKELARLNRISDKTEEVYNKIAELTREDFETKKKALIDINEEEENAFQEAYKYQINLLELNKKAIKDKQSLRMDARLEDDDELVDQLSSEIQALQKQNSEIEAIYVERNGKKFIFEEEYVNLQKQNRNEELALENEQAIALAEIDNAIYQRKLANSLALAEQEHQLWKTAIATEEQNALDDYEIQKKQLQNKFKNSQKTLKDEQILAKALEELDIQLANKRKAIAVAAAQAEEKERKINTLKLETEINELKTKLLTSNINASYQILFDLLNKEKELLKAQMDFELANEKLTEEERLKIKSDYALKEAELQKDFDDKTKDSEVDTTEVIKTELQKRAEAILEYYAKISGSVQMGLDTMQMAFDNYNAAQEAKRQEQYAAEEEAIKDSYANRLISQEEYDNQVAALEKQKEQKERAAKRKQFVQDKANSIVNATIQGAQAVLAALTLTPPLSYILAAVNAGLVATQIGLISSQKFTAARGGIVPGQPSSMDSVDAVLAPGEAVINANSASMFPTLISEINKAGGGIPLAPSPLTSLTGGNSGNMYQNNEPIQVYVLENDISNTSRRVARIRESSMFG
jgi:hypothetical protein